MIFFFPFQSIFSLIIICWVLYDLIREDFDLFLFFIGQLLLTLLLIPVFYFVLLATQNPFILLFLPLSLFVFACFRIRKIGSWNSSLEIRIHLLVLFTIVLCIDILFFNLRDIIPQIINDCGLEDRLVF